ncbi:MAG TPA: hypothetical protein V6C97_20890 [Oculatellaceae cyanobacterium]
MTYCVSFLDRSHSDMVVNAELCESALKDMESTAHTLRFKGQNGSCSLLPADNPDALGKV